MNASGSGSCSMVGFDISRVRPSRTCRAPSGTRCTVRVYADCAEEAKQTLEVDF